MLLRRFVLPALAAAAVLAAPPDSATAQDSIRVGYAVSKSGPNAPGAGITTIPNYQLWVHDVNEAGGIQVGDKKLKIEVVEYDDRSQSEEAVRLVERLIDEDKVDFVLPPWGTGLNLAVAPLLNRAGYPHLCVTCVTDKIGELAPRWPNAFWFLSTSAAPAEALVELLKQLRDEGKIGGKVAMVNVADQFGLDLANAARPKLAEAGFELVMDKSYPLGTQDLGALITEAMRLKPDAFLAFSYPPDTFGLSEQAKTLGFNPKVFYTAVGTAFPIYLQMFGGSAEGVIGIGGWDPSSAEAKAYFERHKAVTGAEPDQWASPVTYASLQVLQQAIERAGTIDHAAVIAEIAKGGFDTVAGPITFEDNQRKKQWLIGQWQGGTFYGISPADLPNAKPLVFPKPAW